MKNEDLYKKTVEEASLIKYEMNEDHASEMKQLKKIYKAVFNRKPTEFTAAKDMIYFKGGWPKPETPPKALQLADKIADVYAILSLIGEEKEFASYLEDRGLKIEPIMDSVYHSNHLLNDAEWKLDSKRAKVVNSNWEELFDVDVPDDYAEMLKIMMRRAKAKQKSICELGDEIKEEKGGMIEADCEVKKTLFVKAVDLKFRQQVGKDIGESLDKEHEKAEAIKDALAMFDDDGYIDDTTNKSDDVPMNTATADELNQLDVNDLDVEIKYED